MTKITATYDIERVCMLEKVRIRGVLKEDIVVMPAALHVPIISELAGGSAINREAEGVCMEPHFP